MLQQYFSSIQFEFLPTFLKIFFSTSTIWLPIFLFGVFLSYWLKYVRTKYLIKQGGVLLEIKLPREIFKSPLAMELILTSLHQTGKKDYLKTFFKGETRPWFTLEIASIEGNVRFFIWTQLKFRKLIESQFYAQYPGVEIYEADDYTKNVHVDPANLPLWGTHFKLTKADIYPIKTYVDYGLDREQEEESKIDPMTSVLEFLGSLKAGEQIWLQILFQGHRAKTLKDDAISHKVEDWKKEGKAEIKKLVDEISGGDDEDGVRRAPTMGEKETIAALERSLSKLAFEVGIRGFYIARTESFDSIGITGLIGSFRQYNSETLNGFKLAKFTDFDYPWQDFRRKRRTKLENELLEAYKLRSYFNIPYKHLFTKPFILTTEELATIFHLPGKVVGTPTLTKISSKKNEAPANLPI